MQLTISRTIFSQLVAYGEQSPIDEVCGALLGHKETDTSWLCDEFIPLTNVSDQDKRGLYIPDPNEMFQVLNRTTHMHNDAKLDLVGIFHTHTRHEPCPSVTDVLGAGYQGFYVIYSPKLKNFGISYYDGDEEIRVFEEAQLLLEDMPLPVLSQTVQLTHGVVGHESGALAALEEHGRIVGTL